MSRTLLPGLVATVLLAGCAAAGHAAPREQAADGVPLAVDATGPVVKRGAVTKVVDGDTIDVRLPSGAVKRVRLLGIDTPEVYGTVECGGPEASAWTKKFLPVDSQVELVSDPSQSLNDQYGRQLRYVTELATGVDVNRKIVAKGWARLFVWHDDPFQRVASYRSALRNAKDADRGIWGLC
jgi:endonuclease YncB( thermonuclease family)